MKAVLDCREGVKNTDTKADVSSISDAISIIDKLDGKRYTLVLFEKTNGDQLMVGGGSKDFVVTLTTGSQNLTLKNELNNSSDLVEICAGGQYGDYPAFLTQNLTQAKKAVEGFFDGTEQELVWI